MKKVLFATTALVATAGIAAADINFSGYGRFGVLYNKTPAGVSTTDITSRFRLTIDGSTEADNGLSFGARLRFEQENSNATQNFNGARFFAKSGGFEVGVGNVYGAFGSMPGLFAGSVGLTGLGWGNVVTGFNSHTYDSKGAGNSTNGVEMIYSGGNFNIHLSSGDLNTAKRVELAGNYTFNDWTVGLGFADFKHANFGAAADMGTKALLTVGGKLGAANVGFAYAQNQDQAGVKTNRMTLSGSFEVGAATKLTAYIASDKSKNTTLAGVKQEAYGLGVSHSLGGGASIQGGVVNNFGNTRADLGVLFNF